MASPVVKACLKSVKFQFVIFVLSGSGISKASACSNASVRRDVIHSGSFLSLENCSIYSLSNGNFVSTVIHYPSLYVLFVFNGFVFNAQLFFNPLITFIFESLG